MKNFKELLAIIPMMPPSNYPRDKGVYLHRKATDKVPMYVGIGVEGRPEKIGNLGDGQRNDDWHEVFNTHGRTVEMLHTNLTEWQAKSIEVALIFKYRNVYGRYREGGSMVNLSDGGEGSSGYKYTEAQKKNVSDGTKAAMNRPEVRDRLIEGATIAQNRPEVKAAKSCRTREQMLLQWQNEEFRTKMSAAMTGRVFSEEHRAKIKAALNRAEVKAKLSAAKIGRVRSEEHCANLSAALTGRKLSEEHCANLSAARTGKFVGEQSWCFQGFSVGINDNSFVIFSGNQEMKEHKFSAGNICECISGNRKSHKSFRWTRRTTLNPEEFAGLTPFNELSAERLNAAKNS